MKTSPLLDRFVKTETHRNYIEPRIFKSPFCPVIRFPECVLPLFPVVAGQVCPPDPFLAVVVIFDMAIRIGIQDFPAALVHEYRKPVHLKTKIFSKVLFRGLSNKIRQILKPVCDHIQVVIEPDLKTGIHSSAWRHPPHPHIRFIPNFCHKNDLLPGFRIASAKGDVQVKVKKRFRLRKKALDFLWLFPPRFRPVPADLRPGPP